MRKSILLASVLFGSLLLESVVLEAQQPALPAAMSADTVGLDTTWTSFAPRASASPKTELAEIFAQQQQPLPAPVARSATNRRTRRLIVIGAVVATIAVLLILVATARN